ncbi:MAG: bifunctional DNA-formamidopyrimidine glycosylase/DNA-(apurinic or apyrimidinic site) lyase [Pseudomonadota bacterium]
MPELPEVETVKCGLLPCMEGAAFKVVALNRPDLRYPLPAGFADRLTGACVGRLRRRGKYLVAELSTGESLIMHLGMSGRFTVQGSARRTPGEFYRAEPGDPRHDHVIFTFNRPGRPDARVTFNDPRRFGFMDIVDTERVEECRYFAGMGPEPLSADFTPAYLNHALARRTGAVKAALLDQRLVAGVGNIYACEALYRAGVSPRRTARTVPGRRAERLQAAIVSVLEDAIAAGGSSLRDFADATGALGYFQHRFDVYDREGEPCRRCAGGVKRLSQAGRSTFFCGVCQR